MKQIRFVEIENFKTFGKKIRIDIDHPTVIIGPNNSGKTTVIQALALWSKGIKSWYDKKGSPKQKEKRERISAGINRLNIFEVPVTDTRNFWKNTKVGIPFTINVGIQSNEDIHACKLIFKRRDTETIYCQPAPEIVNNEELLAHAAGLHFNLLYPMSGIESEETLLPEGRINVLMGQGQTAQVLRNLCYKIIESDENNQTKDWDKICNFMKKVFMISLNTPGFNEIRGNLNLSYRQMDVDNDLDISLAGRGLQQMLLIISYLYSHKSSILMIDEPDAHLEILRQKQVFEILKDIAEENTCQVIIATHSEVILDDAVDINLTLLINGEAVNLATLQDMKNSLRNFGIEHYVKAKINPHILYLEGSTDLEILKELAKKLNHPCYEILNSTLNYYYTQNIDPDDTLENRLERTSGSFGNYKQHFHTVKKSVPELKGIGIFDSDGLPRTDSLDENLAIVYWKEYELENYFITIDILLAFINHYFGEIEPLFQSEQCAMMKEILDNLFLQAVFNNDKKLLAEFHSSSKSMQRTLLKNTKLSSLTEHAFQLFAERNQQPLILKKGEFYKILSVVPAEEIPVEISEKLDLLQKYLS